jgi:hypothetical protein
LERAGAIMSSPSVELPAQPKMPPWALIIFKPISSSAPGFLPFELGGAGIGRE